MRASPHTVHFRCMSVIDHVDHAAPRAPGRWTMARPRKGTTRSRGRRGSGCPRREEYEGSLVRLRCDAVVAAEQQGVWVSGGMAWPAVGVVGGGEASAASQPAMGGRSTRHDRRWFGRLEQEDQRLKKHYGHWIDIVWSLEVESCILTKLTKPSVPVNLVGPQVSLPLYWVPANRGSIHFFCA